MMQGSDNFPNYPLKQTITYAFSSISGRFIMTIDGVNYMLPRTSG